MRGQANMIGSVSGAEAAVKSVARDTGPIGQAINSIANNTDRLHDAVSRLESILEPILSDPGPSEGCCPTPEPECRMQQVLGTIDSRIENGIERIVSLIIRTKL